MAVAVAVCTAAAVADARPASADPAAAAGAWELTLGGSRRQCRVTFGLEPAGPGRAIRFPLGCRRALPILATTAGWRLDEDRIELFGADGQALLTFRPQAEPGLFAAASGDQAYRLERQPRVAAAPAAPVPPSSLLPPLPPPSVNPPRAAAVDLRTAPPPETLPGLYAVDRATVRDVCRVTLSPTASGAGRFELRVIEGCADRGLAVFDPVAWRYDTGRLILTARRGFETILISDRPTHWRRDPEVGAPLILRKVLP